jgi:hypothetical protein
MGLKFYIIIMGDKLRRLLWLFLFLDFNMYLQQPKVGDNKTCNLSVILN